MVSSSSSACPAPRATGEWPVGDGYRESGFAPESLVDGGQQRAAVGDDDPLADDVGGEFWWGALERLLDGLHDAADGCFQGAPYACCVEGAAAKQAACDVSTPDESLGRAWLVEAGTDLDLHCSRSSRRSG